MNEKFLETNEAPYVSKREASAKRAKWNENDRQSWRIKLTDLSLVSKECDEDWTWTLYSKDNNLHSELLESYADKLLDHAMRHEEVQQAMMRLDGPQVHHPALYWVLWQTIESIDGTKYGNRYDRRREIETRPNLAAKLIDRLKELIKDHGDLTKAIEAGITDYERLAPPWEPGWTQSRLQVMQDVHQALIQCAEEMESVTRMFLAPLADNSLSARQADTKALHSLFVMSESMLGQCRWGALTKLMNAISSIREKGQPFKASVLQENERYFRANHQFLVQRHDQSRSIRNFELHSERYRLGRMDGSIPSSLDIDTYLLRIFSRTVPLLNSRPTKMGDLPAANS
jgi:hypothetical protein